MFSAETVTTATSMVDLLIKLGGLLACVFVVYRSGSSFFLRHRLMQVLGDTGDFHDPTLHAQWQSHFDLQRYNARYGLRLRSTRQLAALTLWLEQHQVGVEEAARAGRYFDANALVFKTAGRRRVRALLMCLLAGALASVLSGCLLFGAHSALLQVKQTGTWFWAEADHAGSVTGGYIPGIAGWALDQQRCLFADEDASLAKAADRKVVCELLLRDSADYLRGVVASQKQVGAGLFIVGMLLIGGVGMRAGAISCAVALDKRITASADALDLAPTNPQGSPLERS